MEKPLTYPEVGATREGPLPAGYAHAFRDVRLGEGRTTFDRAVEALFDWRMHRAAGFDVSSVRGPAAEGLDVAPRFLGLLPIRCRVVYVVDRPDRRGFGYGTLPGHPERGEEAFVVSIAPDGEVRFQIRAFSRPASPLVRLGGPVPGLVQRYVTDRYVKALRELSTAEVPKRP